MEKEEIPQSELLEYNKNDTEEEKLIYTNEESTYLANLKSKLEHSRDEREVPREEFDGLNYYSQYDANERGANTTIKPLKNKGESTFQSGTLRTKMMTLLNSIESLNLRPQVMAYNMYDLVIASLGQAMEDIIEKVDEVNNDDELKSLRQYELLKQGTVFIETNWIEKIEIFKEGGGAEFRNGRTWNVMRKVSNGMPKRNIISGLGVFLGNIRTYHVENQPYLYTVEYLDYNIAEEVYGGFEMWKYVSKYMKNVLSEPVMGYSWRLFTADDYKNKVEIIKYQSIPDNEYQIIINGVPMLSIGHPIPWGRFYSIDQQNLEPISFDFAYGKSFIFKNKNLVSILDEMMKLAVLKTQISFKPPMVNMSGRIVPRDAIMPGKINNGLRKGDLVPVYENMTLGVNNSEFAMIQEMRSQIDKNTVSQTFAGQKEGGGAITATQTIELQRQSKLMMAQLVLSATLLEQKLALKELYFIIEKWFDPEEEKIDMVRNVLNKKYRIISRQRNIVGEGKGVRMVIPTTEKLEPEDVYAFEEKMRRETGKPFRAIFINPEILKNANFTWYVSVSPKEKKTSELNKLMLEDLVVKATSIGLPLNKEYVGELFAEAYELDASKLLDMNQLVAPQQLMTGEAPQGAVPDTSNIKPNNNAIMQQ